MTLFRATLRLRELKALVVSTIRKASVAGLVKMDLANMDSCLTSTCVACTKLL